MISTKKIISGLMSSIILFSSGLQLNVNAAKIAQGKSEVGPNKKYSVMQKFIDSTSPIKFAQSATLIAKTRNSKNTWDTVIGLYKKATSSAFKTAQINPTIENWKNAENCCSQAVQVARDACNKKEVNIFSVKSAYAAANILWETAVQNPTIKNWKISAKAFNQAAQATSSIGSKNLYKTCKEKIAQAYINIAEISWNTATQNPTIENWTNSAKAFKQAAKATLSANQMELYNACKEKIAQAHININEIF